MELVRQPVTGEEEQGDIKMPYEAFVQFYHAFNNGNIDEMSGNWDHSDNTVMDNSIGGIMRGWSDIRSVYEAIFNSSAEVYVEFYDYLLHIAEEMFYVVGRERGYFKCR